MATREGPGPAPVSFGRPPVTEVAIGVQFAAVPNLAGPLAGSLWASWRDDYPTVTEQPWLSAWPSLDQQGMWVQFGPSVGVRTWFLDASQDNVLQLQNDRLIANWRRVSGTPYPRYPEVRGRFARAWVDVMALAKELTGVPPIADQVEVSYINTVSASPSAALRGWSDLFGGVDVSDVAASFSQEVSAAGTNLARATTTVNASSQPESPLNLTISVRAAVVDPQDPLSAVDGAHDVIVRRFATITSLAMHQEWEAEA